MNVWRAVKRSFPFVRAFVMVGLTLASGTCTEHAPTSADTPPVRLAILSGDWQRAPGLARLDAPIQVHAFALNSVAPVGGVAVKFAPLGRAGRVHLSDTTVITGSDGSAYVEVTLAGASRDDTVRIAARGGGSTEVFTVIVTPTPALTGASAQLIRGGDTLALRGSRLGFATPGGRVRFGDVSVAALSVTDSVVRAVVPSCIPSGPTVVRIERGGARTPEIALTVQSAARTLALPPFGGLVLDAREIEQCVSLAEGARYLIVASVQTGSEGREAFDVVLGASNGTGASSALGAELTFGAGSAARAISQGIRAAGAGESQGVRAAGAGESQGVERGRAWLEFERALRGQERSVATYLRGGFAQGLARSGAAWRADGVGAVSALAGPSLGQRRNFRVIDTLDASRFASVAGVVRFIGSRVAVWVDTSVTAAIDSALLAPLARAFNDVLVPVATDAFGLPSDVDRDGLVHVVLTPVVNGLTSRTQCTLNGFVGGFFSAHDLYPGTANANGGEYFYGMVPDSLGAYGCPHPVSEFERVIRPAFIHELQHAISYNQHVLLRGGREESLWLNEGMSHIAEELGSLYYERRYPAPTGRSAADQLFPDSSGGFILFNLINAYLHLRQPYASSVTNFTDAGTIEERGAAWLFLRWLADQYGNDILRRLVQTRLTGRENVRDRTGESVARLVADLHMAAYADSLPGQPRDAAPPRWRFRTRNLAQLFQRLNVISGFPPVPIEPAPIPVGGSVRAQLRAGGALYAEVRVPSGTPGVTLRFARSDGAAWPAGSQPQIAFLRLP